VGWSCHMSCRARTDWPTERVRWRGRGIVQVLGKMKGAVGNYNAHISA
jgi:hypothetical protein